MSQQSNMQKDVLVLNMEQQLEELADEMFGKKLEELEDREVYSKGCNRIQETCRQPSKTAIPQRRLRFNFFYLSNIFSFFL